MAEAEIGGWPKFFRCDFAAIYVAGWVLGVQNFVFFDNRAFKNQKSIRKKLCKFSCKIAIFELERRMPWSFQIRIFEFTFKNLLWKFFPPLLKPFWIARNDIRHIGENHAHSYRFFPDFLWKSKLFWRKWEQKTVSLSKKDNNCLFWAVHENFWKIEAKL